MSATTRSPQVVGFKAFDRDAARRQHECSIASFSPARLLWRRTTSIVDADPGPSGGLIASLPPEGGFLPRWSPQAPFDPGVGYEPANAGCRPRGRVGSAPAAIHPA